jgi:Protein of unknown function (DUF2971)
VSKRRRPKTKRSRPKKSKPAAVGARLYKYLGPQILDKALAAEDTVAFKCSLPRDFNDPYELFLTIDYDQDSEVLAYYRETIGEVTQHPTTCFSKSPAVIPMWAHYAENHEGAVVEVDEACIMERYPDAAFGDVDYADQAEPGIADLLRHAHATCKPRHVYMLQHAVGRAAYFTKLTCWSYEQERRLVVGKKDVVAANGIDLLRVPTGCVTALIAGCRASKHTKKRLKDIAARRGTRYFEMNISRSTSTPYFIDGTGAVWEFRAGQFDECELTCGSCGEPVQQDKDQCPWCSITKDDEHIAAGRNPMRMLSAHGLLEEYYRDMAEIDRRHREGE